MTARNRRTERRRSYLLPRTSDRRMEILEGTAFALCLAIIGLAFVLASQHRYALRIPSVAAVVSAVLVDLANADRLDNSLAGLTVNPKLVAAAQAKADDMAKRGYFAHTAPDGADSWYWFRQAGYDFSYAGENLAADFTESGDVERAWMDSPTHRDNILNGKYTEVGIATAEGIYEGRATTFVVQEFGRPARPGPASAASVASTQPQDPSEPAVALAGQASASTEDVNVLGAASPEAHTAAPAPSAPLWAPIVANPRETLRYVYYFLGALVLLVLAYETGFEFHARHRRKAVRAGILLVSMAMLFVVANVFFFVTPVLAAAL